MEDFFMKHGVLMVCILLLIAGSVLCQAVIGIYLQKLIKETEEMDYAEDEFLKKCMEQFRSYKREERGSMNISIFVDKQLNKIFLGKLTLEQWRHISGQLILLSVLLCGIGACRGIIAGETLGEILPFYIISLMGLYLHFSLSGVIDGEEKKRQMKTNIIDFLENRMPISGFSAMERMENAERERTSFGREDERELEELLREILT